MKKSELKTGMIVTPRNEMQDNELFVEKHEQEEDGLNGTKHAELCDNPHCVDGIVDHCYNTPIFCQCCE